jgi:DNA-binding XRE family transcriptional regulator
MTGERITLSEQFETLIARAGLSKAELAQRAGVNRQVIFRALNPAPYESGGTLRGTTAWKLAQAYAEQMHTDLETAFSQLFVVIGQEARERYGSESPAALDDMSLSAHPQSLDTLSSAPRQSTNIRLDDENLTMLQALMEDEDRSSQHDMIRVLIKRAHRTLVMRRSTTESTHSHVSTIDKS